MLMQKGVKPYSSQPFIMLMLFSLLEPHYVVLEWLFIFYLSSTGKLLAILSALGSGHRVCPMKGMKHFKL